MTDRDAAVRAKLERAEHMLGAVLSHQIADTWLLDRVQESEAEVADAIALLDSPASEARTPFDIEVSTDDGDLHVEVVTSRAFDGLRDGTYKAYVGAPESVEPPDAEVKVYTNDDGSRGAICETTLAGDDYYLDLPDGYYPLFRHPPTDSIPAGEGDEVEWTPERLAWRPSDDEMHGWDPEGAMVCNLCNDDPCCCGVPSDYRDQFRRTRDALREALEDMYQTMREYDWDADGDATVEHSDLMKRVRALLDSAPESQKPDAAALGSAIGLLRPCTYSAGETHAVLDKRMSAALLAALAPESQPEGALPCPVCQYDNPDLRCELHPVSTPKLPEGDGELLGYKRSEVAERQWFNIGYAYGFADGESGNKNDVDSAFDVVPNKLVPAPSEPYEAAMLREHTVGGRPNE